MVLVISLDYFVSEINLYSKLRYAGRPGTLLKMIVSVVYACINR